jgi:hypothetical protein
MNDTIRASFVWVDLPSARKFGKVFTYPLIVFLAEIVSCQMIS